MNRLEQLLAGYAIVAFLVCFSCLVQARQKKFSLILKVCLISVIIIGCIIVDAMFLEPNWITINNIEIKSATLATVLNGVEYIKIVQISDLHVRSELGLREKSLINKVNTLKPDIILITGDILEQRFEERSAFEVLHNLKAKYGIYAVPGNTDYRKLKPAELRAFLESSGVTLLLNEKLRISTPSGVFWLVGLDDPVSKRDNIQLALKDVPVNEPKIVMAHSPDVYTKAVLAEVDLLVVGHTHGGQVGIPWLVKMSDYANRSLFMSGLVHDGRTVMYVNKGIGMKTLPVRFLCRPEIAVFSFHN